MNARNKQQVRPIKVPWMISPSTSRLRLSASESVSDGTAEVVFLAHFGLEDIGPAASGHAQTQIVSNYSCPPKNAGRRDGAYRLVKVVFGCAVAVRMLPSFSDSDVVDPERFGFDHVPFSFGTGQSIESWLRDFRASWIRTNQCPDPRMYEVENSSWLDEIVGTRPGFGHFLVLGHDAFIEVIAKNWQAESLDALL